MASPASFETLADRLAATLEALTDDTLRRIRTVAPEFPLDIPAIAEVFAVGTRGSLEAELMAFGVGGETPHALSEVDAEGARLSARSGVPLHLHLALYRAGHAALWQAWFDLVESENGLPAAHRRELVAHGSQFFFAYSDQAIRLATQEYHQERERHQRTTEQQRVHQVREILRGAEIGDAPGLGYDLDGFHVGVIASGTNARLALRSLAGTLDCQLLVIEIFQQTWWAWLGRGQPIGPALPEAPAVVADDGTTLGLGTDQIGIAGFRESHDAAAQAFDIGRKLDRQVTRFEDVALEAIALRDADAARRFLRAELDGIDGTDERSARLRNTLAAYFEHGQNAASTAASLGVHEQTVAKRLRTIEERLNHGVTDRRAELELALRLRRCLRASEASESA